jgi:hypothetical protein
VLALLFFFALLGASSPARADDAYVPSRFRVYAGPALWVPFQIGDVWAMGGTIAFQWYPEARRVFFVGGRAAILDDPRGIGARYYGGFFDAEIGVRPRIVTRGDSALAFVASGGAGGLFIACSCSAPPEGFAHLALRAGVGVDAGVLTMNMLGGIAMYASNGAAGETEVVVELGARF